MCGYLTQLFYHMNCSQTMLYSTSDFGLNRVARLRAETCEDFLDLAQPFFGKPDAEQGSGFGCYAGCSEMSGMPRGAPVFKGEAVDAAEVLGVVGDDRTLVAEASGGDENFSFADGWSLVEQSGIEAGGDAGAYW